MVVDSTPLIMIMTVLSKLHERVSHEATTHGINNLLREL